jgi:hypothetical protein
MPRKTFLASVQDTVTGVIFGKDMGTDKSSFYDCSAQLMDGDAVKMEKFKGDVLCVVNVASK